jgi:hypothetical protein
VIADPGAEAGGAAEPVVPVQAAISTVIAAPRITIVRKAVRGRGARLGGAPMEGFGVMGCLG